MRRKIKLAYIDNASARRASFKKRSIGLMKKVRELTILCDVSACVIIYGPGEYDPVAVWPNEDETRRLVQRFRTVPEMERRKKMVTQESYLRERATKMSQQIERLIQKNRETVLGLVMRKISNGKSLDDLGEVELKGVMAMLEEKVGEIDWRISQIEYPFGNEEHPGGVYIPRPHAEENSALGDFQLEQNHYRDSFGGFHDFQNAYLNGNGNKNNIIEGLVDEMEYEGNFNQEIVNNYARNVENMGLGFPHGSGFDRGVRGFEYMGANNVKAGNGIEEIEMAYETGKVVESDGSGRAIYNFGKQWPAFISPSL